MKVLVVGSGAREHAIAKALYKSRHNPQLFCCGTTLNPGIQSITSDYWVGDITHINSIVTAATKWQVSLAIIGPEAPLESGLADALWAVGIAVIGPRKKLARIETSKSFARELMHSHNIAGLPKFKTFNDMQGIEEFLRELGEGNYVVKANGLMSGKGVKVAGEHLFSLSEAMNYCKELFALNQTLVIEEKLVGQEFSLMCFTDGNTVVPMPVVQDHKRAFEGDKGPNTGGMGSYSMTNHSLPFLTADNLAQAIQTNQLVLNALMQETGEKYIGILYGGFIATAKGTYVIEFNARFGDPEVLNVLSLLKSDFYDLCLALIEGNLHTHQVEFANLSTVCKYVVPIGYPDNPVRDSIIEIDRVAFKDQLYLASVDAKEGVLYASGSRTAAYVGIEADIHLAEQKAEQEVSQIKGLLFHRKDIGTEQLIAQRVAMMNRLRSS